MRSSVWMGTLGLGLVLGTAGTAAAAERINEQGRFAVGAERLFGVAWTKETFKGSGADTSESATSISFLTKQTNATGVTAPRVAFDYFVIDGLSLGAAIGYATISIRQSTGSSSMDGPTIGGWLLAPRVGYAYMFNDIVGLWPRAGITYTTLSADQTGVSTDSVALSVEVPLVITPAPHAMILIAPTLDWGFAGSAKVDNATTGVSGSVDETQLALGLHAGLGIWF